LFFERPQSGEIAILVQVGLESTQDEADAREFEELAISAGAIPAALVVGSRRLTSPRFMVGSGKVEEIAAAIAEHHAELVLFNRTLTPSQERNLEKELKCRVLDRTGLILDIFAQRARSHEGKLQVELAQLKHASTRLVRGWTHLDRQKGGIGLRGAGETQLEIDQRLIGVRMKQINKQLERVRSQRDQGRRARKRAEIPTVSLVGYTNAGKSSLFNRLSGDAIYVADQLFATLDSTLRKVMVPNYGNVIIADTVGFIRQLPHQLVDAFRATLEETIQARLLLHVVDCHNDERLQLIDEVDHVLQEIGADDIPRLMVFNKVDLLGDLQPPGIERDEKGRPIRVWVSANTGAGIPDLRQAISELLAEESIDTTLNLSLSLSPGQGRLRARFYQCGAVLNESSDDDGKTTLQLRLPRQDFIRLLQEAGMDPAPWLPARVDPATDLAEATDLAPSDPLETPPHGSATLDEAV
jgi:GTP-binding protein HflX